MEERINTLKELYDRTRKCTGITIPENVLVVGDFETSRSMRFGDELHKVLLDVIKQLAVTGVENISLFVILQNPERKFCHNIVQNIKNYLESVRPGVVLSCKFERLEDIGLSNHIGSRFNYIGEYKSAVVISDVESPVKYVLDMFRAEKVVCTSFSNGEGGNFNFNLIPHIVAFKNMIKGDITPGDTTPFLISMTEKSGFEMNARIVAEIVYMLCSDELEDCFKSGEYQHFSIMLSDSLLIKRIYDKFRLQGVLELDKNTEISTTDVTNAILEEDDDEENFSRTYDYISRPKNWADDHTEWNENWSSNDYDESLSYEATLQTQGDPQ